MYSVYNNGQASTETPNPLFSLASDSSNTLRCCSCGSHMFFSIQASHRCNVCRTKYTNNVWLRCNNEDCDSDICVDENACEDSPYSCLDTYYRGPSWVEELLNCSRDQYLQVLAVDALRLHRVLWYTMVYEPQLFVSVFQKYVTTDANDELVSSLVILFLWCYGETQAEVRELLLPIVFNDSRVQKSAVYEDHAFRSPVRNGHKEFILQLEKAGYVIGHDSSAIRAACKLKHSTDMLEFVLGLESVDPSAGDSIALRFAVRSGNSAAVAVLLTDGRCNPAARNSRSIVDACAGTTDVDMQILQLLLEDGRAQPDASHSKSFTEACRYGNLEAAELLLQDGRVDPIANYSRALRYACAAGHAQIVDFLLCETESDPSLFHNESLFVAVSNGHVAVVQLLLQDERVNAAALHNRALKAATVRNSTELVDLLLNQEGVAVSFFCLLSAVKHSSLEIVSRLLPRAPDELAARNNKILLTACRYSTLEVVNALLECSQVESAIDPWQTLVHACRSGNISIVDLLLNRDDVRNAITTSKASQALHGAIRSQSVDVVERILQVFLDSESKPTVSVARMLKYAVAAQQSADVVAKVLEFCTPQTKYDGVMLAACRNENGDELVKLLVRNPSVVAAMQRNKDAVIQAAAKYGNKEGVTELLRLADPNWGKGRALEYASSRQDGYEMVKVLLQDGRFDPEVQCRAAFRCAATFEILSALYPYARLEVYHPRRIVQVELLDKISDLSHHDRLMGIWCIVPCLPEDILRQVWQLTAMADVKATD